MASIDTARRAAVAAPIAALKLNAVQQWRSRISTVLAAVAVAAAGEDDETAQRRQRSEQDTLISEFAIEFEKKLNGIN
jgi:hypothetical protein